MARQPADYDAQRTLEQHALRNVHVLARRLGYTDALDRYGERFGLICIGVVVFLVVSAVAISILLSPEDPRALGVQRCRTATAVTVMWELRSELKAANPALTPARLEKLVRVTDTDVKREAAERCATIQAAK